MNPQGVLNPPPRAKIFYGLSWRDYAALDALNCTLLKAVALNSALHAHKSERKESRELDIGKAAHLATLEPQELAKRIAVWTGGRRAGKAWDAFVAQNRRRTILRPDDEACVVAIREALARHPVSSQYIIPGLPTEVTIVWHHPRLDVDLKVRIDLLHPRAIVDLKTARSIKPGPFATASASYGYHIQAALYSDAYVAATGEVLPFKMVAIENHPPYDSAVYDVPDDVQVVGRELYERAIETWLECGENEYWPGMAEDGELTLRLPSWAQIEPGADYTNIEEVDDAA